MKTKIMAILLSCIGIQLQAHAGTEGHGGDPLQKLFLQAQPYSAERIQQLKKCSFSNGTSTEIQDWILAHRSELVSDLLQTQLTWVTDSQPTCAFTQAQKGADITLSFEACRPLIKNLDDASHMLIHESVHHLGITNETFPERIAEAIDLAIPKDSCPSTVQDPFHPDACSGDPITTKEFLSHFSAGGEETKIKNTTQMVFRHRKCLGATEDQCTEWTYDTAGQVSLTLAIRVVGQPLAWVESFFGHCGGGCIDGEFLDGVTAPKLTSSTGQSLGWYGQGDLQSFKFKGEGRMTKDCLVMRSKVDLENEAAFLLNIAN